MFAVLVTWYFQSFLSPIESHSCGNRIGRWQDAVWQKRPLLALNTTPPESMCESVSGEKYRKYEDCKKDRKSFHCGKQDTAVHRHLDIIRGSYKTWLSLRIIVNRE